MPIPTRSDVNDRTPGTRNGKATCSSSTPRQMSSVVVVTANHPSKRVQAVDASTTASHIRSSSSSLPRPPRTTRNDGVLPKIPSTAGHNQARAQNPGALSHLGHARSQSTNIVLGDAVTRPATTNKPVSSRSLSKPVFNTFQQHFSPRKPSGSVATQRAKTIISEPGQGSGDNGQQIFELGDELLHLALVYHRSVSTCTKFAEDVEHRLNLAFTHLRKQGREVEILEAERQRQVNAVTLSDWLCDVDSHSDARKVEDLSFCLNEIADLNENRHIYQRLMSEFGRWLTMVMSVIPNHESTYSTSPNSDVMMAPRAPGASWAREINQCHQRLDSVKGMLEGLGGMDEESGIGFVVSEHRKLVSVMLWKIITAEEIVQKVNKAQEQWISHTLDNAVADVEAYEGCVRREGIWTSFEPG